MLLEQGANSKLLGSCEVIQMAIALEMLAKDYYARSKSSPVFSFRELLDLFYRLLSQPDKNILVKSLQFNS